jgi:lipoic acid synthetase
MLGIGEKEEEIKQVLQDMQKIGVDILTIGQYLQPSQKHQPIDRWVTPEEFAEWKEYAFSIGFGACESGPLVRSSYHAEEQSAMFDVRARRKAMLDAQQAEKEAAEVASF